MFDAVFNSELPKIEELAAFIGRLQQFYQQYTMLKDTGRRFETEELNEFSLDGFMMERVQPTCRVSNPRWPILSGDGGRI